MWKTILPLGRKDPQFGKWSPDWDGPYIVSEVYDGGAYRLITLDGEELETKINGNYLKEYYPTLWESIQGKESWLLNTK